MMDNIDFQLLRERVRGRNEERDRVWRLIECALASEERPDAKDALVALAYQAVGK
jgi:hypothetical protein